MDSVNATIVGELGAVLREYLVWAYQVPGSFELQKQAGQIDLGLGDCPLLESSETRGGNAVPPIAER